MTQLLLCFQRALSLASKCLALGGCHLLLPRETEAQGPPLSSTHCPKSPHHGDTKGHRLCHLTSTAPKQGLSILPNLSYPS